MVKRYDCTAGGAQFCQGCYTMEEESDRVDGNWVRAEDYDAAIAALRLLFKEMELSGNLGSKDYGWPVAIAASRAILDSQSETEGKV
jgi:hypothetical protein